MKHLPVAGKAVTLLFTAAFLVACSSSDTKEEEAAAAAAKTAAQQEEEARQAAMQEEIRMREEAVAAVGNVFYFESCLIRKDKDGQSNIVGLCQKRSLALARSNKRLLN